jgi:hypothetical protein
VFLHRHREIGAAFHGGVVGHHHHFLAVHLAHTGHHAAAGRAAVVHAKTGQRRKFEEGAVSVEQRHDALARQQFAAGLVFGAGSVATTLFKLAELMLQVGHQAAHVRAVLGEFRRAEIQL